MGGVALDGVSSDEQVLADLCVDEPVGGQFCDAALAGGQGLGSSEKHPAGFGPRWRATPYRFGGPAP
jgi:hypothetical protein